jgi:hypothetical protein
MGWSITDDEFIKQINLPLIEVEEIPPLTAQEEASLNDFMEMASYACVGGSSEYQEKIT